MDGLMIERQVETEAARQLRAYFRSFGFDESVALDRLVERALATVGPVKQTGDMTALIRQQVEAWFIDCLGLSSAASGDAETIGRAAFLLSDAARRWPAHFLDAEAPAEMIDALRLAAPIPIPRPAVTMAEQSLVPLWSLGPVRQLLRRPARKAPQS